MLFLSFYEPAISSRRRFIFDVLKYVRLPLVASKLLEAYVNTCSDISLKVAVSLPQHHKEILSPDLKKIFHDLEYYMGIFSMTSDGL